MRAPTHPRQAERLDLLHDLDPDTGGANPDFDALTRLASSICAVPMAAVTLLDARRQIFASEVGIGLRETSLDDAICTHAILETDVLEIADTRCDPRTADNPLVTADNGLRFYAGAPLIGRAGLPLGTLCVLDHEPRTLTEEQRQALRVLARQAVMVIELRHALVEAEILRREVDHRVRNSLQILASLTAIEARTSTIPDTRRALDGMRTRIRSIADLHGQLHARDNAGSIDLAPYLSGIVGSIAEMNPQGVTLESRFDPVDLPARQAVALGLLINEFYTNSIKHAFEGRVSGHITLRVARTAPDVGLLTYADDGIGMSDMAPPAEADAHSAPAAGLGSQVIVALVQQLGGTLDRLRLGGEGLTLTVEFPIQSR